MARTITEKEQAAKKITERLARRDPAEDQWRDAEALRRVAEAFRDTVAAESALAEAVADARAQRHSWAAIAAMIGVSKQTAQTRYREPSN